MLSDSKNRIPGERIPFVLNALTGEELRAGNRDVSRFYSWLTDPELGGCTSDGYRPIHECESRQIFSSIFETFLSNWRTENQLIFYFSGHGDIKNNQYCIQLGTNNLDWLPFQNLINDLGCNGVQRAIIILDTCHSGAATEGIRNSNFITSSYINENNIPKGIVIIASCKRWQFSQESPDGSSGIFTNLFCQAIESGLDGKVTEDKIYPKDVINYIQDKLATDKKYSNYLQEPVFGINNAEGAIWISKVRPEKIFRPIQAITPNIKDSQGLKDIYLQQHPNRYPCLDASIDDLDLELLEQFCQKNVNDLKNIESLQIQENNILNLDLSNINLLKEVLSVLKLYSPIQSDGLDYLHKAAVLCFCRNPARIYPQARAILTVGNPGEKDFITEYIKGPLSYQVTVLVQKVAKYSQEISYIAGDGQRRDINYVARELISNAIAHRDYQSKGTVKVSITPQALEVYSPGKFPSELSWDKLINSPEISSNPVDAAISYYLTELLVFEGIGRGFNVFKQYTRDNGAHSIICKELEGPTIYISILHRNRFKFTAPNIDSPNRGWKFAWT